jgi:hypothetical protein
MTKIDCGQWVSIKWKTKDKELVESGMHGELWTIYNSDQATSNSKQYGCANPENPDDKVKCYHGWVPPRIICHDLTEKELEGTADGKVMTLRVNISDVGDKFFDSALAVDSIEFSTKACDDETGRITPPSVDPDSRVNDL